MTIAVDWDVKQQNKQKMIWVKTVAKIINSWHCKANEPVHEISNIVVCATSKASDQPTHTGSLIRAFANRFSIL